MHSMLPHVMPHGAVAAPAARRPAPLMPAGAGTAGVRELLAASENFIFDCDGARPFPHARAPRRPRACAAPADKPHARLYTSI